MCATQITVKINIAKLDFGQVTLSQEQIFFPSVTNSGSSKGLSYDAPMKIINLPVISKQC